MEQQQTTTNPQLGTTSSITLQDGTQLDPKVVKVMKAIRSVESNGNFEAVGDNGASMGAYQWNNNQVPLRPGELPANWKNAAQKYLGDSNAPMTPGNQNKVAYYQIKEYKDQGLQPEEVAARWNGAHKDPTTGKFTYNNPQYGVKFREALMGNKTGYQTQPSLSKPPATGAGYQAPEPSLGQDIVGRFGQATTAVSDTIGGKINPLSGVLQVAGAAAGGLGDIVNKGLGLIPGVKQLENLLGKGVGALMNTPTGQSVAKSIQSFSKDHPELAGDVGAVFNIVTAIPILKGLSVIKNLGADAISQTLKGVAVKGFANDLAESATTKTAQRLFSKDVVDTVIKTGAVPELITQAGKTKLSTEAAQKLLGKAITRVDDEVLQPALKGVTTKFNIEDVKAIANDIAINNLSDPAAANKILDRVVAKYGEDLTLEQLNNAKRQISQKITEAAFSDPDLSSMRIVRMALQNGVEIGGQTAGLNIGAINKEMASLIKAQDFLGAIDGKIVPKKGVIHGLIRGASTVGGEVAGNAVGIPFAGALVGNQTAGTIENLLTKLTPRSLRAGMIRRTAQGAVTPTLKQGVKGALKLGGGVMAQKLTK